MISVKKGRGRYRQVSIDLLVRRLQWIIRHNNHRPFNILDKKDTLQVA